MSAPRVVHISPWPPTDRRLAELTRIFGQPVEVIELSHLDLDPAALVHAIRTAEPDAVVLATATPDHRQAIEALANERPVLRPMFKRVRNARGEPEDRPAGLGLLRAAGRIEPIKDGALAR
ncbi:MAG: hypothetical protein ACRDYA_19230 [Egibacteraceae bacterium]